MIKNSFVAIAVTLGVSSIATASYADVTVVSQIALSRPTTQGTAPISRTVTAYFKDGSTRIESNTDKSVILYNAQTKIVSVLNPEKKTYYEKSLASVGSKKQLRQKLSQFATITTSGKVQAIPAGQSQTIAGVTTKTYSLLADVSIQPKIQTRDGSLLPPMQVHVDGRFQAAAASTVIPDMTAERIQLFTEQLLASGWVPDPVLADFMKLKVVPLKANLVITSTGIPSGNSSRSVPGTATLSMNVVSLDEQTPLSNSLFLVPSGYTKVTPPSHGKSELGNLPIGR